LAPPFLASVRIEKRWTTSEFRRR